MSKPVVVQVGVIFEPKQQIFDQTYDARHLWRSADPLALLEQAAPHCQALLTSGMVGVKTEVLERLPKLELISCFGVGVDGIDIDYCRAHGIAVTNTPDVLTEDVADMALALTLGAIRQVPAGDRFVRDGSWLAGAMPVTRSLQRKHIGIVGLGRIGAAIAKRCAAFNTEIGYFGPRRKADAQYRYFDDIVALAQWADVLIAACPGGKATEKIVSRAALSALGDTGVFINIARGSVVDQAALVELLVAGKLGGAGIDVFVNEPNVPAELIALPHVVLHPHQGSATFETRAAMGQLALDNLSAFFAGQPLLTPV